MKLLRKLIIWIKLKIAKLGVHYLKMKITNYYLRLGPMLLNKILELTNFINPRFIYLDKLMKKAVSNNMIIEYKVDYTYPIPMFDITITTLSDNRRHFYFGLTYDGIISFLMAVIACNRLNK